VSSRGQDLNVLLIEDNRADARIFEELVRETGDSIHITWAHSITDARTKTQAQTTPFSLVVTDLGLPDAQGMATINAVLELFPDLPVVVMTGLNDSDIGLKAVQRGCQDYVVKGFSDPYLLVRMLRYATQRHEAERQIKESEERFRTLVQMSPDAIIIASETAVSFVNPAALSLFQGLRRQDLEGQDLTTLLAGPGGDGAVERICSALRNNDSCSAYETTLADLRGRPLDVELSVAPISVGGEKRAQVILRDVSFRRERDRELRLAQAVFETTAEAMMITNAQQKILTVNPAFCEVTGYTIEDVVGRTPNILASGRHDDAFYKKMHKTLEENGHWRGEIWNRRADGAVYVQRVTISAIRDSNGKTTNFVGVFSDITQEKEASEKLLHSASHDALTGLPNRSLLHDRLEQALNKANRDQTGLTLLFIDLDGFKPINDTYGHLIGDLLLQGVSERLRQCVRESDTVARLGGDEFIILSLGTDTHLGAATIAQKIIDRLSTPFTLTDVTATVGCSIGFSLYPRNGKDSETLLSCADRAMYAAKSAGRGCYRPLTET
jgi:diguanylate cyclase (GGDEF)-like protein/PAS domain S-box-containing protein